MSLYIRKLRLSKNCFQSRPCIGFIPPAVKSNYEILKCDVRTYEVVSETLVSFSYDFRMYVSCAYECRRYKKFSDTLP